MSWSVSAVGKAPAVRASIADQFTRTSCIEPEESVKKRAAEAIDKALEAQDPSTVVKVVASGHMTFKDYTAKTGASNYCSVLIEPIGGFVE